MKKWFKAFFKSTEGRHRHPENLRRRRNQPVELTYVVDIFRLMRELPA